MRIVAKKVLKNTELLINYLLIGEQTLGKLIRTITFLLDNKA